MQEDTAPTLCKSVCPKYANPASMHCLLIPLLVSPDASSHIFAYASSKRNFPRTTPSIIPVQDTPQDIGASTSKRSFQLLSLHNTSHATLFHNDTREPVILGPTPSARYASRD